jgi:hypothetical protein
MTRLANTEGIEAGIKARNAEITGLWGMFQEMRLSI